MAIDCSEIENWACSTPDEVAKLTARFEQLDQTLTIDEIARAYIAQAYVGDEYSDLDFNRMAIDTMMKTGDIENALRLAWDTACRHPFNLDALNALLQIVPQEHDIWTVAAWRFSKLLKAITSTGDGMSEKSAFCVICVQDEYMVMRAALEITGIQDQQLIINGMKSFDCFTVTPCNSYPHDKVFFEITPFNISAL